MTATEPRKPNPEVVRRIVAHLWGEDFVNLRAAVESFANGWTVVPKVATPEPPEDESNDYKVGWDAGYQWAAPRAEGLDPVDRLILMCRAFQPGAPIRIQAEKAAAARSTAPRAEGLDYDALAAFIDKHRIDAGVCACGHWDKWAPLTFGAHIATEARQNAARPSDEVKT